MNKDSQMASELMWGRVDPLPKYRRIVKHETISLRGVDGDLVKYDIPQCRMGYGVANIQLVGMAWHNAKLCTTAPQVISSLPSPKYGNSFFITEDGNYLPFVPFHGFEIRFTHSGNDNVNLRYDIVECAPPFGCFLIVFKSFAIHETCNINGGHTRTRLFLNNPVEKIILNSDRAIRNTPFVLLKRQEFPFSKVADTEFHLDLGGDFMNLTSAEILFDEPDEKNIEIYTITYNVLRSTSGMYGLTF